MEIDQISLQSPEIVLVINGLGVEIELCEFGIEVEDVLGGLETNVDHC